MVVTSGLSVIEVAFELFDQVYELAPPTLNVPLCSGQIDAWVIVKTGLEINPTATVLVIEQLLASVAVSV